MLVVMKEQGSVIALVSALIIKIQVISQWSLVKSFPMTDD